MTTLLAIRGLNCRFDTAGRTVHAVRDVDLDVSAGETLALVGESGCGKSTLARSIVGLHRPVSGSIRLDGVDLLRRGGFPAELRRDVQFVFQDPFASLNPRRTAAMLIREPLDVHRVGTPNQRRMRVSELMEQVGLRPDWGARYPHEFSGGQRQRIGIARALALRPKLIVCDEPVSALDVSIQAQVINLLAELQRALRIAYLFISHDLALVELFADRVAIMYGGRIVETGPGGDVWRAPQHPFTRCLIDAIPVPDPAIPRRPPPVAGSLAGLVPQQPPLAAGLCAFLERCPDAHAACTRQAPPRIAAIPGHDVLCHGMPIQTGEVRRNAR